MRLTDWKLLDTFYVFFMCYWKNEWKREHQFSFTHCYNVFNSYLRFLPWLQQLGLLYISSHVWTAVISAKLKWFCRYFPQKLSHVLTFTVWLLSGPAGGTISTVTSREPLGSDVQVYEWTDARRISLLTVTPHCFAGYKPHAKCMHANPQSWNVTHLCRHDWLIVVK